MSHESTKVFSKYLSVPYLDQGRDPQGWDCYGLYFYIAREHFGVHAPAYLATYPTTESPYRDAAVAAAITAKTASWRRVEAPEPGDGIVLAIAGQPLHCGIVISAGIMLHCMAGRGTAIEDYTSRAWAKRIEGFYKWK